MQSRNADKGSIYPHGYWLRSDQPKEQLKEVIQRFDLKNQIHLFQRCLECNDKIKKVSKRKIRQNLLAGTNKYYQDFYQCTGCKKIYWKGSHYWNMIHFIQQIIETDTTDTW